MKKEVFLAISIGFVLGLVITFGIWTANKSLKNLPQAQASPTPTLTDSSTPDSTPAPKNDTPSSETLPLTVSAPMDEALVTKSTITVTGKTSPNAAVSMTYESGEQVVEADASGNFTAEVKLEGGYNLILLTAYTKSGESKSLSLTVTYTTAAI